MIRPRENGQIVCIKLIGGDQVLGRVKDAKDWEHFVLEMPVLLQLVPNGKGGFGHAMIPYMGSEVIIHASGIVAECPESAVDRNAMNKYIQAVTGIRTATSMPGAKGGV